MRHRLGLLSMGALCLYCCCGATAPQTCATAPTPSIGPSTGELVGAVAVVAGVTVGAIVLVHVEHTHHNLKGCVFDGPAGLELLNEGDNKPYALDGSTTGIHTGDRLHLHGGREKQPKGSERRFTVARISKDYGPCKKISPKP